MLMCMKDDRLPWILPASEQQLKDSTFYLPQVDDIVWEFVSEGLSVPPQSLRSGVLAAAQVSSAYFFQRLAPVRELPWSLLGQSAAAVLYEFEKLNAPQEEVSVNIKALLDMCMQRQELEKAIVLLQNASWSTASTERGTPHRPGSFDTIGVAQRPFNATVCCGRPGVCPNGTGRLSSWRRPGSGSRNCRTSIPRTSESSRPFVSDLLALAASPSFRSRFSDQACGKNAVKRHAASWRSMPVQSKLEYDQRAMILRREKQEKLGAALATAIDEVRDRRVAM